MSGNHVYYSCSSRARYAVSIDIAIEGWVAKRASSTYVYARMTLQRKSLILIMYTHASAILKSLFTCTCMTGAAGRPIVEFDRCDVDCKYSVCASMSTCASYLLASRLEGRCERKFRNLENRAQLQTDIHTEHTHKRLPSPPAQTRMSIAIAT
jgi:hypothetical protein